jgi:hypothetical protein
VCRAWSNLKETLGSELGAGKDDGLVGMGHYGKVLERMGHVLAVDNGIMGEGEAKLLVLFGAVWRGVAWDVVLGDGSPTLGKHLVKAWCFCLFGWFAWFDRSCVMCVVMLFVAGRRGVR